MESQWTAYTDQPSNRQARYAPQDVNTPQQASRDTTAQGMMKQEAYTPSIPSRAASMQLNSPAGQHGRSADYNGDGDGDVPMEDADPYNKAKYPSRPMHQQRHSQQFIQQEESAAARRYSPMNLSPTSPYISSPQPPGANSYGNFSPQAPGSRQSPSKSNPYISPPQSYYSPPSTYSHDT